MVTIAPDRPLRVLHLEDSTADHELTALALRRGGVQCELQRVDTLAEFQQLIDAHVFDVILADYRLPGFTALDAWSYVAQKPQHPPFVLLSGAIGEAGKMRWRLILISRGGEGAVTQHLRRGNIMPGHRTERRR